MVRLDVGSSKAIRSLAKLAGYRVHTHRPTGEKTVRASPHSSQVEHGQVAMVRAAWNAQFVSEHQEFPDDTWDDQVDAAADGFRWLTGALPTITHEVLRKLASGARGLFRPRT